MRNRVYSNSPRVRLSLALLGTFLAALTFAGCGGGGGSSSTGNNGNNGNTGSSPGLATVTGRVLDNSSSHAPVVGALVTVVGTGRSNTTRSDGSFTITNVPLTATQFTVASPNPLTYYNYAQYNSKQYDTTACKLPLPAPVANAVDAVGDVWLFAGGTNPPPPPPVGGCP